MGKHYSSRYSSRWGRFRIDGHFMAEIKDLAGHGEWEKIEALMGFMAQVFIVRAADAPDRDSVEYWGISRHFDELEEGEYPPEYDIEFQREREDCPHCQGAGCCDHCEQGKVIVDYFKAARRIR